MGSGRLHGSRARWSCCLPPSAISDCQPSMIDQLMLRSRGWLIVSGVVALGCASLAVHFATPASGAAKCTVTGSADADYLTGTSGPDVICGHGGPDELRGFGGNDLILGGPGDDRLIGGKGNDTLIGGPGADVLFGGSGLDHLRGGPGADLCRGISSAMRSCASHRKAPPPTPSVWLPPVLEPSLDAPKPDTVPPQLAGLEFSSEIVDITTGDWWVRLSASAWDESGIESIKVAIDGPGGQWREVNFGAGPKLTELSQRLDVPNSTPLGEYRVTAVTVVDSAGNTGTYDLARLSQQHLSAQFEVYVGPDEEDPNLAGLAFESAPIDTSDGPVTVEISIDLTDPGSGVDQIWWLRIRHPTSEPGVPRIYTLYPSLVSGDAREGTWRATLTLPHGGAAGFYSVENFSVVDGANNWAAWDADTLEDAGFPAGFSQVGVADTTPPEIIGYSLTPQVLHTAAGDRSFTVEIEARDDWSGIDPQGGAWVSRVSFWFTPPGYPVSWGMGTGDQILISGTRLDGTWRINGLLPTDAPQGAWGLRWIWVSDLAGNDARLEGPELESKGWDLTFENLP
jgi:hypothetical protein